MDRGISYDRTAGVYTDEARLARVTELVHRYLYRISAVSPVVSASEICATVLAVGPTGALEAPVARMAQDEASCDYRLKLDEVKAALQRLHVIGLVLTDKSFDTAAINDNGLAVIDSLPSENRPFRSEKSTWRS